MRSEIHVSARSQYAHLTYFPLLCDLLLPARSQADVFARMKTFRIASQARMRGRDGNVLFWRMMTKARVPSIRLCGAVLMEMLSERKLWRKCSGENDVKCDMQTIKFKENEE